MNESKNLKLVISHLISIGVCSSQKDLGEKLGYSSQFSFSTAVIKRPVIVGDKLKKFYPQFNLDYLFGNSDKMFLSEDELKQEIEQAATKVDYYNKVLDVWSALKFPNWKQFWRTLDYKNEQLFYDLKVGKAKKLPEEFVAAVCKKYPHVNPNYLLEGEEPMFRRIGIGGIDTSMLEDQDEATVAELAPQDKEVAHEPESEYRVSCLIADEDELPRKQQLLNVDLLSIDNMTIREYSRLNADKLEFINRCSLLPEDTIIYKVHSDCLEPFAYENDYLFLRYISRRELKNQHVYLADSKNLGKMVKRLERQGDDLVLSGSFTRRELPVVKLSKDDEVDFYDLVVKVVNDFSKVFSEKVADMHYMAVACVEANKGLIENHKKAEENVKLANENVKQALTIIENLSARQ